jgi:inner membrane protein
MEEQSKNTATQIGKWFSESYTVKLLMITFLVLLMLIPSAWIGGIISDRQSYADEAVMDITNRWSGQQTISGPVLVLTYEQTKPSGMRNADGTEIMTKETKQLFILPETLNVQADMEAQTLSRGIFDVRVYSTAIHMDGQIQIPDLSEFGITTADIQWEKATLISGISDMRGITNNPEFTVNAERKEGMPYANVPGIVDEYHPLYNGIRCILNDSSPESEIQFTLEYQINGSSSLYFTPIGNTTTVHMNGNWADPSFTGNYLPKNRSIQASDFSADWHISSFSRPFPKVWENQVPQISHSTFGIDMLTGMNDYVKISRTAKYGLLIIIFTFISLFLTEVITKTKIHPFQYTLIGGALVIYYTLLLSISEQFGYDIAYLIASVSTTVLISLYAWSFSSKKVAALLAFLLMIFYAFIFTITRQEDFALLLGSIGLFLVIAILMFVTRKVKWYTSK